MIERRQFSRILYSAPARISHSQGRWQTEIKDLSLHGLLLARPEAWQPTPDQTYQIQVSLHDSDIVLQLTADLVSHCEQYLRMQIKQMDIDSASHLKRLVELNVGTDQLLHRELEQLADLAKQTTNQ